MYENKTWFMISKNVYITMVDRNKRNTDWEHKYSRQKVFNKIVLEHYNERTFIERREF